MNGNPPSENESPDFDINALMRPHKICLCKSVTEKDIRDAVLLNGARNFEEVQQLTKCSTGCGTCEGKVRQLVDQIIPKNAH